MQAAKPTTKPSDPRFSCGPCRKPSTWSFDGLKNVMLGRSHRDPEAINQINEICTRTADLLNLPEGYQIAVVPASNTGAFEMAMWSLLGQRPVSVLAWENFGKVWLTDAVEQLKLDPIVHTAPYGELPDLKAVDFNTDVCFTWNGTAAGVCVPNGDFIPADREGLTICDATSSLFAMPTDFEKLDVITFSWQKVLGGEAAHGMLILSPRAIERLENWTPPWPIPKLFRLTAGGKLDKAIFAGNTINTVSMLCVADCLFSLKWVESMGGPQATIAQTQKNAAALDNFVQQTSWIEYLVKDPSCRSTSSVCLRFTDPEIADDRDFINTFRANLQKEGVAYDIASYPTAPPGLRIWCGATVSTQDVIALCSWLEWAWHETRAGHRSA